MTDFSLQLREHAKDDREQFGEINTKLEVIKDNHLAHIQSSIATIQTNLSWLMRAFWIVVTATVGILYKLFTGL